MVVISNCKYTYNYNYNSHNVMFLRFPNCFLLFPLVFPNAFPPASMVSSGVSLFPLSVSLFPILDFAISFHEKQQTFGKNLNIVKWNLECNFLIMRKWFYENHMVLNLTICHNMLTGNNSHDDKIILTSGTRKE